MTTATELQKNIGKTAVYPIDMYCVVDVKIIDARNRYGNIDYKIEPLSGRGSVWVEQSKVRINT